MFTQLVKVSARQMATNVLRIKNRFNVFLYAVSSSNGLLTNKLN